MVNKMVRETNKDKAEMEVSGEFSFSMFKAVIIDF